MTSDTGWHTWTNALPASMRQAIKIFQSNEMSFERVDKIGFLLDSAHILVLQPKAEDHREIYGRILILQRDLSWGFW